MRVSAFRLFLLLLALFALAACSGKVAVLNTEKVFQESNAGKAGLAYLDDLSKELQGQLIASQQKAEAGKNKKAAQDDLQVQVRDAQQRFGAEQQQVMNKVSELYQNAMESVRAKGRYDVILSSDVAVSSSPRVDVTKHVIDEMNRTPVTFTPLAAQPEAAEAPASGNQNAPGNQNVSGN